MIFINPGEKCVFRCMKTSMVSSWANVHLDGSYGLTKALCSLPWLV